MPFVHKHTLATHLALSALTLQPVLQAETTHLALYALAFATLHGVTVISLTYHVSSSNCARYKVAWSLLATNVPDIFPHEFTKLPLILRGQLSCL